MELVWKMGGEKDT